MFSENTDIRVRTAQQADLAAVAELFDAYRQFYQQAPDLALAQRFIQDRWARQESLILVAVNRPVFSRQLPASRNGVSRTLRETGHRPTNVGGWGYKTFQCN